MKITSQMDTDGKKVKVFIDCSSLLSCSFVLDSLLIKYRGLENVIVVGLCIQETKELLFDHLNVIGPNRLMI